MDSNQETFNTWNQLAKIYEEKFMNLDIYNSTYDYFCNAITKPNAKILELGCGPGNITKYLLSQRPDFEILGLDIAPNMIELAKNNYPTANFMVMDTRDIEKLTDKYDGIIGGFCIPYLSNNECKMLINHSYDLLNNEGVFYISFVEGDLEKSDFKTSGSGRVYFNYHDIEEIKYQLTSSGFKEIKTFKIDYKTSNNDFDIHTILIAKKIQ